LIAAPSLARARSLTLPDLSHQALNVWLRHRDVYRRNLHSELTLPFIEPLLVLVAMGLGLGRFINLDGNIPYIRFLAPGVLAQFAMFQATFECCWMAYRRMESGGTYAAIAATPATLDDVVAGDMLWAATRATINTFYVLVILLIFTPQYAIVRSPLALLVLPAAFLLGLAFGGLSLCFSAIAETMSFLGYYFNIVVIPMFWLSGSFFPLERLPEWAQQIAWALPLTQVIAINRHLLNGHLGWFDLAHVATILAEIAVFGCIAMWLVRRKLIK
jgi:lipooligosaccharide transport system permease protein